MRNTMIAVASLLLVSGCLDESSDKGSQGKSSPKPNALEETFHPLTGSKVKFENFQDIGGLNKSNMFFGLTVKEVVATFTAAGSINEVSFRISRTIPASDLRAAMSKLCEVQESQWEVQRGDYQSGKVKGPVCDTTYIPFNDADWVLVYKKN